MDKKKKKKSVLFSNLGNGKKEWTNMPEFVQARQQPYQTIIIHFESENDVKEFANLTEQKITSKTKSMWHPKLIKNKFTNRRYIDES